MSAPSTCCWAWSRKAAGWPPSCFEQFNVSLATVRQKVEQLATARATLAAAGKLRQTERYTRVLRLRDRRGDGLVNNYVGTEHLLLGLLREPEGTAARACWRK